MDIISQNPSGPGSGPNAPEERLEDYVEIISYMAPFAHLAQNREGIL